MADDNMFPKFMNKVDKRGIPTVSIILLAIFTIFTCQYDFTTLVMATTPIQLYLYLLMVVCVIKIRKRYPAAERKQMVEIFRAYFYDAKRNKMRSKGATIGLIVLYVLLMVGLIGGMFAVLSLSVCKTMYEGGLGWLYLFHLE